MPCAAGSSPLARGLPPSPHGATTPSPDHPRSRGVYLEDVVKQCLLVGSSPLARGLLVTFFLPMLINRIIPARAGFTGQW